MPLRRLMAAVLSALALTLLISAAPARAAIAAQWKRSLLVYHDDSRTDAQWQKHLMRVGPNGGFSGQWLFDAAVITAVDYHGKDLMYGRFTGDELAGILDTAFADAARLDSAAIALTKAHGAPPAPLQVSITLPWLDPGNHSLKLPGRSGTLDLGVQSQRVQAADWYLDQVKSRAQAAHWQRLTLFGAYYHREELIDATGDTTFAKQLNADAHSRGMKTVWVPVYGTPHAWDAASYGFDVVNVQPGQVFRSPQYGGEANGGRLYAVGTEAVKRSQSFEYEASTAGETQLETWASRQYLAVAHDTGADAYPQVFFTGLQDDMFDLITTQTAAAGDRWWCYQDLADYLAGQTIANLEIGLPWPVQDQPNGTRVVQWTPPAPIDLWALRMDFKDRDSAQPWRGRLTVRVDGPGGTRTSFGQRTGSAEMPPYQQVGVPLALSPAGDSTVSRLTITLTREPGSDWPNITRLVAARYIVPLIGNGVTEEPSTSSYTVQQGPYADTASTHLGFTKGKLTDGQISANGNWNWPGALGWNFYSGLFTVTVDLGQQRAVSEVALIAHYDQTAGIGWPISPVALVGVAAPARKAGLDSLTEKAAGTSGASLRTAYSVPGQPFQQAGTVSMKLAGVTGRYVTVVSHCVGWCLLDEVQVKDSGGQIRSTGKPYTITPQPSVNQGQQTAYGDNSERLTNNAVTPEFQPQFGQLLDGIPTATGGTAEVTWAVPRTVRAATIWFTRQNQAYGVTLPVSPALMWRDQNGVWSQQRPVTVLADGASPHATLPLPGGSQVTGVRAVLPPIPGSNGWYMVSEITAR
ncbi:DUF4855 domain-containing protein [Streptomyces melanogenes]|uniref:DUF4855 domain-containing protein n=1 Tax=Streptomyces melanogenes TaxID=67326 RepID=UPI00167E5F96|nr:DUF4855 domain-containing protein [Streptomyces melanogenes]GGP89469.1 hypothetical protein GCM10010278_79950 [Streptomyces melanogenes]